MLGSSLFHILWTSRSSFSPCPYGIVVAVFHFDSGGRKAKVRSTLEGGLTGGFRTGGRTEDAIGLAGDDEGEACRGASCKVTVLVKVIGASMEGLRWDR